MCLLGQNENYGYEITGKIGDDYKTEKVEIPYYVYVKATDNTEGKLKEEGDTITYYYRKMTFNFSVEKTISSITLNGENMRISDNKLAKVEIKQADIGNTELIVKYNIKVTNEGEIKGKTKIIEMLPEGYTFVGAGLASSHEYGKTSNLDDTPVSTGWTMTKDGNLEAEVELELEESKTLSVTLRWENQEKNLGLKTNTAKIEETKNAANFKDTNEEDNMGEATIVLSIKTGEVVSTTIIVMIMGSLIICSYITIKTIKRKSPDIKDIKFLK